MTTSYFDLGDGKLFYEVAGEKHRETVVFSHAAFLDSGMWDVQWQALIRHYRGIRYDMLGYGNSDPANGPRTRRHDLYKLLRHLQVEKAHLIGCSMGGEIVLDLALEHPDLVASLVIINGTPSGFVPQGEPPRYLFEMIEAAKQGNIDLASELQLRIWFDGDQRTPEQVDNTIRQQAARMNRRFVENDTAAKSGFQSLELLDPPAIERLGEVRTPTLIVTGALDHAEILKMAQRMVTEIPDAKLLTIPNSAHVPNMEHAELFNNALLQFLGMSAD